MSPFASTSMTAIQGVPNILLGYWAWLGWSCIHGKTKVALKDADMMNRHYIVPLLLRSMTDCGFSADADVVGPDTCAFVPQWVFMLH